MIHKFLEVFELLPVDWSGVMAVFEVFIIWNILQETRRNKKEIAVRRRSEQLQFYAYFWQKWDRVLESLPYGVFEMGFEPESDEDKKALMVTLRSYFDLCAQEFFMHEQGVIEEAIWQNWARGLTGCMRLPIFKEAYTELNVSVSYPEFHIWLSKELAQHETVEASAIGAE